MNLGITKQLNYTIYSNADRAALVNELFTPEVSNNARLTFEQVTTQHELEVAANFILYGKDPKTDKNFVQKKEIQGLFDLLGKTRVYPTEQYIDKMIAVTSSSPAYVCLFIEAMADGAVRLGFSREDAYLMAEQAVLGTAKYLRDGNVHPAVMKDRVCSPAGTTIEAVAALEEMGLRSSVLEAMEKCDRMTRG